MGDVFLRNEVVKKQVQLVAWLSDELRCATEKLPEAFALFAGSVEICGIEPRFESGFAGGPFAVEHGEPCGIAVLALDHHVLAEDALVSEPEAQCGTARWRVIRVALPLIPAGSEVVDDVVGTLA